METQVRILLLVLGFIILFGVAIDFLRRKPKHNAENMNYSPTEPFVDPVVETGIEREADIVEPQYYNFDSGLKFSVHEPESSVEEDHAFDFKIEENQVKSSKTADNPKNIVTISIMSRDKLGFKGADLHAALNNAHLYFGNNDIFHRHENDDGSGKILFSVAKAVEPGYFYINLLNREHVPGITFIMLPDEISNPVFAFDKMIRAAKQISFMLNGELLDSKRQFLTLSIIDQYRAKLQTNANR